MELERTLDELRSVALHREADMTASVTAYVSAGMAFDDAEEILKAAGFDVRPRPGPREAEDINRPTDWYAVHARIANFARRGLGTVDVFVDLFPRSPGELHHRERCEDNPVYRLLVSVEVNDRRMRRVG